MSRSGYSNNIILTSRALVIIKAIKLLQVRLWHYNTDTHTTIGWQCVDTCNLTKLSNNKEQHIATLSPPHIVMSEFTEHFNLSQRPNARQLGLEHVWDLLEGRLLSRTRVTNRPVRRSKLRNVSRTP